MRALLAGLLLLRGTGAQAQEGSAALAQTEDVAGSAAQAQTTDPAAILAQAKEASGGSAWDGIRTLHVRAQSTADGLSGSLDEWSDVRTGRDTVRFSRPPSAGASGFDGVSLWTQAADGYSYVHGDEDARQGAANDAYRTSLAYWFPERGNATLAFAGLQKAEGQTYDVIRITPQAGRPFDLWIDQATHLIDRFIEQHDEEVEVVRWLDYRPVAGGIRLPFTRKIGHGDEEWDEVNTVQTVEINTDLAPDQFALPPNPPPDYQFEGGKTSTTLPFRLEGGELRVDIKLNGQGPFTADVDTGGNFIVQPRVAERLQLKGQGAARNGGGGEGYVAAGRLVMDSVELGDLRLTRQAFKVLSFYDEAPELSLVGLQLFQRFVVSINFDQRTLTLTRPEQFVYHGGGEVIPFHFQDNQPEVKGSIDGIAGVFTIDTGDNASLLLIAPFVKRHGLVERYRATIPYGGSAVGGATYGLMARTGVLNLFGADGRPAVEVRDLLTRLSQQKRGFDANRYVSGNVGIDVLRQFNLTFDYSRQQIIFEKNQSYGRRAVYNRTGLQLKANGPAWDVIDVVPGSPAAELGIKAEESVVSIDGQDAGKLTRYQMKTLFTKETDSKIVLVLRAGTKQRTVTLLLRDVL